MKFFKFSFLLLIGILFFTSCGSVIEDYNPDRTDFEYFPLQVGNTWTYSVDSTIYDNKGAKIDTINHIVKEVITGSFKDNTGVTNYTIERYNKTNTGWQITNVWSANNNKKQAIKNEDNLRFIKMIFPAKEGKIWDGNAFIDSDNLIVKIAGEPIKMYEFWTYRYLNTNTAERIGEIDYNNIATIQQVDNENSIQKRYSMEKYSKGYGLVYKKMIILNTQKIDQPDTPWELKAEEGFILEQTLLSFEKQ